MGKQISNLYIGEMESPYKLKTVQVLLTTPDYDWERVGFWVNEGPAVIHHNGKIYLTYSASETGAAYCVGMMSASEDSDLLDPNPGQKSVIRFCARMQTEEFTVLDIIHSLKMKREIQLWFIMQGLKKR